MALKDLEKVTSVIGHAVTRVDTLVECWNILATPTSETKRESVVVSEEGTRPVDSTDARAADGSAIPTLSPVAATNASQETTDFNHALATFNIFPYAPAFPPMKSLTALEIGLKHASTTVSFLLTHLQALVERIFDFVKKYWRDILLLTLSASVLVLWQCNLVLWAEVARVC